MKISALASSFLLHGVLAQEQGQQGSHDEGSCQTPDGNPCCYKVDARINGNVAESTIVHGYALADPYTDDGNFADWGWKTQNNGLFNFVEQQQFVFAAEEADMDLISISIKSQDGCDMQESSSPKKYHAMWQGGTSEVLPYDSVNRRHLSVDYAKYTAEGSGRKRGDPIYITLIPCTQIGDYYVDQYEKCTEFDQTRAIAVMVSFRSKDACDTGDDPDAGFDCCHVTQSIGPHAEQDTIDAATKQWTSSNGNKPDQHNRCLKKPSWQCFRNDDGTVKTIQYKGSLVDYILDSNRKEGQGLRIVLDDDVTINLPITTTYLEYTVDPNAPSSCDSLCDGTGDRPSDEDIRSSDGSCAVSAVSSFAAVNKGPLKVSGFGRIDGLPFHGLSNHYFDDNSPNYDANYDWSPGAACPLCNRFCPLTPYAWGVHALTTACYGNSEGDPLTPTRSFLRSELGDALYHIDSALLEISSNAADVDFAVDIADVTVSNMLKRGDAGVMVQSPGHLVRKDGEDCGGLESMKRGCEGPNLPARIFGLKYMGGWHDAVDGPSLKSEGSFSQYMYLHNADDAVKPYSNSEIRDTTVIHGGVGGAITPCTYNLQSYTPGCYETKVINTDIVRIMDPNAGYESQYNARGGVFATRYCPGKTSVGKAWMEATEAPFENNLVDGLVVHSLGVINEVGRAVAITVTGANDDNSEVFFCPSYYEQLPVHLKANAFVFKDWTIGTDANKFNYIDGSGSVKLDVFEAGNLAVVDDWAVDVQGIAQKITDSEGLKCGFSGYYYSCDRSHGFWDSDAQDYSKQCYVYQDGDLEPKTFENTGQICDNWISPRSIQCKGTDRDAECFDWVRVAFGQNGPTSTPFSPGPYGPQIFTTPPPSSCEDFDNWRQSGKSHIPRVHSCQHYEEEQYCTPDGNKGSGWKEEFGKVTLRKFKDRHGYTAFDACCACGGGSRDASLSSHGAGPVASWETV